MLKLMVGFFLGLSLATASAQVFATCDTNGVLKGYIVEDSKGNIVCRDPTVWLEHKGPESYIVCDQ
jgi:hypothetical protein